MNVEVFFSTMLFDKNLGIMTITFISRSFLSFESIDFDLLLDRAICIISTNDTGGWVTNQNPRVSNDSNTQVNEHNWTCLKNIGRIVNIQKMRDLIYMQ